MTTQHVMVDLETQSSDSDAVIISIGAVAFDPNTGEIGKTFSMNVDPETCLAIGLTRSQDTMDWWSAQSAEAQAAWKEDPQTIHVALTKFAEFVREVAGSKAYLWGNGSDFDNVILINAYKKAKIRAPWPYYNNRCYRTLKNEWPMIAMQREGVHHKALSDAISQAKHTIAMYAFKNLTLKPKA